MTLLKPGSSADKMMQDVFCFFKPGLIVSFSVSLANSVDSATFSNLKRAAEWVTGTIWDCVCLSGLGFYFDLKPCKPVSNIQPDTRDGWRQNWKRF